MKEKEIENLEEITADFNIPSYCIDANIVIFIEDILNGEIKNRIDKTTYRENLDSMKALLNLVKENKLKLYLPLVAFNELAFGDRYKGFNTLKMLDYFNIKILDFNCKLREKPNYKFAMVKQLAKRYCTPLTQEEVINLANRTNQTAFNYNLYRPVFNFDNERYPEHDAVIMASSATAHLPLITLNPFCFTYANRREKLAQHNISFHISEDYVPITCQEALEKFNNNYVFYPHRKVKDCVYTTKEIEQSKAISAELGK